MPAADTALNEQEEDHREPVPFAAITALHRLAAAVDLAVPAALRMGFQTEVGDQGAGLVPGFHWRRNLHSAVQTSHEAQLLSHNGS